MNMYAILRYIKTLVKSVSQRATLFGLVIVTFLLYLRYPNSVFLFCTCVCTVTFSQYATGHNTHPSLLSADNL